MELEHIRHQHCKFEKPTLSPFVPGLVRRRFQLNAQLPTEPQIQTIDGVVMFVDISGFTPLTEFFSKQGAVGAEIIRDVLCAYFSALLQLIDKYGGDVVKFAGDALMVLWYDVNKEETKQNSDDPIEVDDGLSNLSYLSSLAVQCALDLVSFKFTYEPSRLLPSSSPNSSLTAQLALLNDLQVKVGVGAGEMYGLLLGGVRDRWEFLLTGDPIKQMSEAEHYAHTGNVVVSKEVWQLIERQGIGEQVDSSEFVRVNFIRTSEEQGAMCSIIVDRRSNHKNTLCTPTLAMENTFKAFVPSPVFLRQTLFQLTNC